MAAYKNKIEMTTTVSALSAVRLYFSWEEVTRSPSDNINNLTYIKWKLEYEVDPEAIDPSITGFYLASLPIYIDGTIKDNYSIKKAFYFAENGYSGTAVSNSNYNFFIRHNADGDYSGQIRANITTFRTYTRSNYKDYTSLPFKFTDTPISLSTIEQKVYLSAANNFTEEQGAAFSYRVKSSGTRYTDNIAKVEACLSITGLSDNVNYREIPKPTTYTATYSYTIHLTEDEKKALYPITANSTSGTVRYYVKTTMVDGSVYWHYLDRTYSIVKDYEPSLAPTVKDTNSKTVALTGDANKLIRYQSNAYFTTGARAEKGASIASQKVTNGDNVIENAFEGVINAVETNRFTFLATDTRGDQAEPQTLELSMIDYFKPTCNQKISVAFNGAYEATASVVVSGSFFNKSFGAQKNSLTLYIRHTQADGAMGEWTELTPLLPDISGDNYTLSFNINGLEYDRLYTFQCRAADKLTVGDSAEYSARAIPVFDWSKEDFNFNVPVKVDSKLDVTEDINAEADLNVNGNISCKGGKVYSAFILSDTITNGDLELADSIANYDFIEIFYTDNNGKTFGSLKIPAKVTTTLTVTLSLIEPNFKTQTMLDSGMTHQTMIRTTTYLIKETSVAVSDTNKGIVYLDNSFTRHVVDTNYIKITKVLGYK